MPKRQRLGWYSFYKKSLDTLRAVIPNPPPINAKRPVRLPYGVLFFDLSNPEPSTTSAPVLKSRLGSCKTESEITKMKELYQTDPKKWTINVLSKKYTVPRSFVINNVMTAEERAAMAKSDEERFLQLPINKVKGALMSARIRQVRNGAF